MEGERRLLTILDILADEPTVTPVELDKRVDKVIERREKEGNKLPEPSPEFRESPKKRITEPSVEKES